jgi:hypothetical protein
MFIILIFFLFPGRNKIGGPGSGFAETQIASQQETGEPTSGAGKYHHRA